MDSGTRGPDWPVSDVRRDAATSGGRAAGERRLGGDVAAQVVSVARVVRCALRNEMIEYVGVSKTYPGRTEPVLFDFSLSIEAGTLCVLLGRSGSGKTTALRLVNRMVEPSSGCIRVAGVDVMGQDPIDLRRRTGYVMQGIGLMPHFTVARNVGIVPHLLGWSESRIRARTEELLALVGLPADDFGLRMPQALSGGQQQRVGVARALAAEPSILLMDEPFGALDPLTRVELRREVVALHHRLKLTTVVVTHDVVEALLMADEIVVLDAGRIAQRGTPTELMRRPESEFVASLMASPKNEIRKLESLLEERA